MIEIINNIQETLNKLRKINDETRKILKQHINIMNDIETIKSLKKEVVDIEYKLEELKNNKINIKNKIHFLKQKVEKKNIKNRNNNTLKLLEDYLKM